MYMKAEVPKHWHASELCRQPAKRQLQGLTSATVPGLVGLGWCLQTCLSNVSPDVAAAGLGTTL